MAHHPLATVLQQLRTLVQGGTAGDLTDGQLLNRFATLQDQPAFEAVMQRHAGLVWGVCLRVLRNRLVNLLYAFPETRSADSEVAGLAELSQHASAAWARLLIERKRT